MPWSLRHTGVYEKLHLKTLKPTWLLIQPSVQILQHLEEYFALSVKNPSHHAIRSLHLHVLIMFATSRTWLDFIDYIRSRIDELVILFTPDANIFKLIITTGEKSCLLAGGQVSERRLLCGILRLSKAR